MRWAVLNLSNIVIEIVSADVRPPSSVKIDDLPCRVGLQWNGWDFAPQRFTSFQFLQRFTDAELELVRSRAAIDATCWRFLTLAQAAQEVDTGDPMTIAGMDYLVAISILTQARRDEIMVA